MMKDKMKDLTRKVTSASSSSSSSSSKGTAHILGSGPDLSSSRTSNPSPSRPAAPQARGRRPPAPAHLHLLPPRQRHHRPSRVGGGERRRRRRVPQLRRAVPLRAGGV
ncbi:Os03g0636600 [Oryza sativa Japonica Group]|uniref:Os03g0636600 protein n=1 Tax=Oryza sativa subsp. japonica TaxID=39947 RepID=A0A0N7KHP5_ORYSJ|nr:hypothetical protein EE612_019107 [Oryza sativa]KAB8092715.1 hypothetical protein EE612_019107 [Oryza sativa]BAS85393.1 Os03g0636600 [Oryza sativa Japonica Group]